MYNIWMGIEIISSIFKIYYTRGSYCALISDQQKAFISQLSLINNITNMFMTGCH